MPSDYAGGVVKADRIDRWRVWVFLLGWLPFSLGFAEEEIERGFRDSIQPFLETYCVRCHNADKMKSGVRVDQLDAGLPDRQLRLWEAIQELVREHEMPPEEEKQPSDLERLQLDKWIDAALHVARSRDVARNGLIRRLTVSQYRNTLRDLLGLEDDLTDYLPPEAVSRDGFENNSDTMLLSPLLLETYFDIASRALDLCVVDESARPQIQNFRMDLGRHINAAPLEEKLILGANSLLLDNADFTVTELTPRKPFPYEPFFMRKDFRFVEGYQGNSTVRGWREYHSIYHAVYACFRGSGGYPLGNPYDMVPGGLLLRPSIPSAELFQVESTYGPKANFKVSVRELPQHGRFKVTVKAAKYEDGLLLGRGAKAIGKGVVLNLSGRRVITSSLERGGVYQVEVYRAVPTENVPEPDASRLLEGRMGAWDFEDGAKKSPFGRALSVSPDQGENIVARSPDMSVGKGDFTVAAWIRPENLQEGGIVASGPRERKGWILDLADARGRIRLETHQGYQQSTGSLASKPDVIQKGKWQHVAAVVKRGKGRARLWVNGYEVASGSVLAADIEDPSLVLSIGRIPEGKRFHGQIDAVRLYRRALESDELQALIEPGREYAVMPSDGRQAFSLRLGDRHFAGALDEAPFLVVRLPSGRLEVGVEYGGMWPIEKIILSPLADPSDFERFEARDPILGVHFGLRRDCGHTLNPVGPPRAVESSKLESFVFEGAINNFPSPDVEENNVNYISGLREIGVRSEYTDGRDRPRLLIRSIEFEGPFYESWPPKTHAQIFTSEDPHEIIRNFASRAFRRPLTGDEEAYFYGLYENAFAESEDFKQSIRDVLTVVLTSPQFLFLIEESQGPESEKIGAFELASKLAYFLWNAPPDEPLLQLAASGDLSRDLDAVVDGMIESPRFRTFCESFVFQWLGLGKLETVETDRKRFPDLTRDAKVQLGLEPIRFVEHLIQHNLPLRHLIDSDFIVANEVVAQYYGLGEQVESGFQFEAIPHQRADLGGLLAQAGLLAALSDGREANPIKRGAWFARKIIAEPPADPPPNVPELSEEHEDLTLRERLALHRDQEGCAKCHEGIDPWGFPFESFDAGGRFVTERTIDASSRLPDGEHVNGLLEFKRYLTQKRLPQVAFSFLKHLAVYAVGRDLSYNEIESLRQSALELEDTQYRMRDLLKFVVQSDLFLMK